MVQIKLFNEKSTLSPEGLERMVNEFLQENEGKIEVKEIRHDTMTPNPNNTLWKSWTIMIVYETLV